MNVFADALAPRSISAWQLEIMLIVNRVAAVALAVAAAVARQSNCMHAWHVARCTTTVTSLFTCGVAVCLYIARVVVVVVVLLLLLLLLGFLGKSRPL